MPQSPGPPGARDWPPILPHYLFLHGHTLMHTHAGSHLGNMLPHAHIYAHTPSGLLGRALSVVTKLPGQYPLP